MFDWFQKRIDFIKRSSEVSLSVGEGSVQDLQNRVVVLGQIQYSHGLKRGIEVAEQVLWMSSMGYSEENIAKFLNDKKSEFGSEATCI